MDSRANDQYHNLSSPEFLVIEGSNNLRLVRQEQQVVQHNVQQLVQQLVELNSLHEGANDQQTNDSSKDQPTITPRQQQAQDAMDLAELIYDMFVANEASGNMGEKG